MKSSRTGSSRALALLSFALAGLGQGAAQSAPKEAQALFAALALAQEEREECLALALAQAMDGDCEGGLGWIDAALGASSAASGAGASPGTSSGAFDEFGRRLALERTRLRAWIELRDDFLAELAASAKPLELVLDGKRVSTTFTREGDELVLARGPKKRLSVRALAPEPLLAAIPKERFAGANEWLKVYPYCVSANPKWKRLTTTEACSEELKRDAVEFYARLAAFAPVVQAITRLAERTVPTDAAGARAALAEVEALLALGREPACVRARLLALGALSGELLARIAASMEVAELVHASVSSPSEESLRLAYDFSSAAQAADWRRDEDYLAGLRTQLEPVSSADEATRFAPGAQGFAGNGEFCWRHALEFMTPMRVRYRVRWEPYEGTAGKVFAFALGLLGDERERHVRAAELGFLYVDEQDGPYIAVRPKGDATVLLGQTYGIEIVHDGKRVEVWVDGVLRAQADAKARTQGRLFLWGHSDLLITVPSLEIEGRVTPASLASLRAEWVRSRLAALGLDPGR